MSDAEDDRPAVGLMLDPGESAVVGTMKIENRSDRQAALAVYGDGPVLRQKMMLRWEDAVSPALRVYYIVMRMYLDPDIFRAYYKDFLAMAKELVENVPSTGLLMSEIGEFVMAGDFRQALDQCFELLRYEALLEEKGNELLEAQKEGPD